jgi:hypothetical protein
MTINKAQGQTIANRSVYLPNAVFSHGELYAVQSHTKKKHRDPQTHG